MLRQTLFAILGLSLSLATQATVVNSLDPNELNTALQGGGTVTFSVDGTITLTNPISLSNTVTLDGTNHSITISGGDAVNLFWIGSTANVTLRNLMLTHGLTNGTSYNPPVDPTVEPARAYGGAISNSGILSVQNCMFSNNVARGGTSQVSSQTVPDTTAYGGAIYSTGQLVVSNSFFLNNSTKGGNPSSTVARNVAAGGGIGGAICNIGGTVVLGNVTFSNNISNGSQTAGGSISGVCGSGYGGAIYSSGGTLSAVNLTVIQNRATGGENNGVKFNPSTQITGGAAGAGAIYLASGTGAISNSYFFNNTALGGWGMSASGGQAKGASMVNAGTLTLFSCGISGSSATGAPGGSSFPQNTSGVDAQGGAIYNSGQLQLVSVGISNSAANGGGAYSSTAVADGLGGAIYNAGGTVLSNVVFAGNNANGGSSSSQNVYGFGWGGAIYNTGYIECHHLSLLTNFISTPTKYGECIYNSGIVNVSDSDCSILGLPAVAGLSFQWRSNGVNLHGQMLSTLNLTNVSFASVSTFTLGVTNNNALITNISEIVTTNRLLATISNVSPNAGPVSGNTSVLISGSGFTTGATAYFSGVQSPNVSSVAATSITATTPAASGPGTVNVTVVNGNYQPVTVANGFTYYSPSDIPIGVNNIPGSGAEVIVTGIPTRSYVLLTTTDLTPPINWQPLATNACTAAGSWTYLDTNAVTGPHRFYRAYLP